MANSLISLFDSFSVMLRIQDGAECGKNMHEYSNYFKQKSLSYLNKGLWKTDKNKRQYADKLIIPFPVCSDAAIH